MKLPDVIPLFPLPNVVFFPRMPLPLHVFEPRYRAMVRDAARGARLIGMVLLRGDWRRDYYGTPPIFTTGTVGEMVRTEELPDGRFNIVLRGLREFDVVREVGSAPYRSAAVRWREPTAEPLAPDARERILAAVRRYLERLRIGASAQTLLAPSVDDETFVNFFAQQLDLPPIDKQALLEVPGLGERAARLVDVVEFRLEELRTSGTPPRAQ
ncbi:MAG TPA: LON peptidase substrate-binding domain-containing protein [Candidatus Binatia bacterium]|nr:LON peptidase substrate-binding domain-containing protein [Candidatus Binatia bacterium]